MKNIIKLTFAAFVLLAFSNSCTNGYIDEISQVSASTDDVSAPVIEITSPTGNLTIPFTDDTTNLAFSYKVSDDIEIGNVTILLDNVQLATYSSFLDYRIFSDSYTYNNLGLGDHTFTVRATDLSGKSSTRTVNFNISNQYVSQFDGEKMYVPFFGGNVFTDILTGTNPTVVGTPTTVSGGYDGDAYRGAASSYISYPFSGLSSSEGISFTFWYKVNATPDRAGIITINDNADNSDENRTKGLRLFREGSATSQTIKMNVGIGTGESWNDGGNIAIPASGSTWVHVAATISPTESKIYFNGVLQRTSTYTSSFDFSESTSLVVGSGAPSFTYWNHLSDLSLLDDLRVYNKALSEAEVLATVQ